jgi:NAD(P)-dependent dehydrogenase (short-subunit alcohol dehydrogenase family)
MQLTGTSAIVTGGSGGLGEATVRRLVGAGVATVIADLAEDRSKELADELGELAAFVRTDVTDEVSVKSAIAQAQEMGAFRIAVAAHGGWAQAGRLVGRDGIGWPRRPWWPPTPTKRGTEACW